MAVFKSIDENGKIILGEQYAGQYILMDEVEPGFWMIKLDKLIPNQEHWLWEAEVQAKINRAIAWAKEHPPEEADLDLFAQQINQ